MTKIITIANSKGGVGKTTLTLNIYNYLISQGAKCAICDTDYQKSITNLGKNINMIHVDELGNTDHKIVLVDTPAYRSDQLAEILSKTDFLLVPVKASILDCKAAATVVKDAKDNDVPFALVLNMIRSGTKFTKEIRGWIEKQEWPLLQVSIFDRVAYSRSLLYESLADEENRKANEEIKDLTNEILTRLL